MNGDPRAWLSSVAGSTAAVDHPELVPWIECIALSKREVVHAIAVDLHEERPAWSPREVAAIVRRRARSHPKFAQGGPDVRLVRDEVRVVFNETTSLREK